MDNKIKFGEKRFLITLGILIVLLCLAYLPGINQAGYLQDDWNTLFITENRGPGELVYHFSLDRPLRGYFALVEDRLLGTNLAAYQVTALLWRLLDATALYLILMLMWPGNWKINVFICALAIIYPGFHEQPHAYDYQAHLFSRMSLLFSFLFSLLPFYLRRNWLKVFSVLIALFLAQISYGLMEVNIGMEVLRLCLLVVISRLLVPVRWWKALGYSLVFILNAGLFIVWRLFFFEEIRQTVDAGAMLSAYANLGVKLLEDFSSTGVNLYRLIISAFYEPLVVFGQYLDGKDWIIGGFLAIIAAISVVWVTERYKRPINRNPMDDNRTSPGVLVAVGLVGSIGALIPIVFADRGITYNISGDRFSFPGSVSACFFLIGLIWLIRKHSVRLAIAGALVFVSILTQFSNDVVFAQNGTQTNAVWWQMSWRAPGIQRATLLTGKIHLGFLSESYTIWAPANMIYYPREHDVILTAEVLDEMTLPLFLSGSKRITEKRGLEYEQDFANLLVFSKGENSCLHVIDGARPEFSQGEEAIIVEVARLSDIDRIVVDPDSDPKPRNDLFGSEPTHDWCYYYQKAQLERQRRDWKAAAEVATIAGDAGYTPQDPMEWLVVLQAYAYTGNDNYDEILRSVMDDGYAAEHACEVYQSYSEEITKTDMATQHEKLLQDVCGAGK